MARHLLVFRLAVVARSRFISGIQTVANVTATDLLAFICWLPVVMAIVAYQKNGNVPA